MKTLQFLAALFVSSLVCSSASAQPAPATTNAKTPAPAPSAPPAPGAAPTSPSAAPPAPGAAPTSPSAAPASTSASFDDARERMEKAQRSFADGRYDDALTEFLGAFERHKFSAFLFNAAVAAERGQKRELSVELYERFLGLEPNAPDRAQIEKSIERLRREHSSQQTQVSADTQKAAIKSLLLVESEPAGAPVVVFERVSPSAAPFDPKKKGEQPGYRQVLSGLTTPANLSLSLGTYFVLVEGFADYNPTGSQLTFEAGRAYVYRASLSQGDFVGRVEVEVPISSAQIWVDDPPPHRNAPRAVGPAGLELSPGKHTFYVEATGFVPFKREVAVVQGKTLKLDARLQRVSYGYLLLRGNAPLVEIEVNGKDAGSYKRKGEPLRVRVPAGDHLVEIDADDKKAFEDLISVPPGQEVAVNAKLEEAPGRGGAVIVTILSAGALAGAIVLNRHVANLDDSSEEKAPLNYLSIGLFAGAGAFAALSVFLFVFDPGDDSTAKVSTPGEFTGELPKDKEIPAQEASTPRQIEVGLTLVPSAPGQPVGLPTPAGLFVRGTF